MTSVHKQLRVLIGILFILALLAAGSVHGAPSGNIIYVNHDAIGNNDGSSWNDAYTDLQDALGSAQAGDEIWVTQGVYYPAPDASDRTARFELQDGVGLYGGFAGQETERDQRDWAANVTVLSGDLDRNDIRDGNGVVTDTRSITGTNACNVVTVYGVTETTVLDGFSITAGRANCWDGFRVYGGGMYSRRSNPTLTNVTFSGNFAIINGGGMVNSEGSPTLTNCIFSGNRADQGGGMRNQWGGATLTNVTFSDNRANMGGGMNNSNSNPKLTNVTFSGNIASVGGGMHNWPADPIMVNVTFISNTATHAGGGMYNWDNSGPTLTNCIFSGNNAYEYGGGMYSENGSSPMLIHVTFSGNQAGEAGGGMFNSDSSPKLVNSILWGNSPDNISNDSYSNLTVTYSNVGLPSGVYPGVGNINQDPRFVQPAATHEAPTMAGNYRLRYDSPAIDAGNTLSVTTPTDLDGNPRVVGDNVDMGTYEHQAYALTLGQDGAGDVTGKPNWPTYTYLDQVVLTATAHAGWTFAHWSGDVDGTENPLALTIQGDTAISATFTQDEYGLELNIVGEGEIDVYPDQETYHYSDVITLTATADPGWSFAGWSGDIVSSDNPLELTIQDDTELIATFTQDEYTLEVGIVGEGDVDIEPEQDTYVYGDVAILTATAHPDWTFAGWSGDVDSTANLLELTIEGDTTITATFEPRQMKVYLPLVLTNH